MADPADTILALDVGERRIGVARANLLTRLPQPLTTLVVSEHVAEEIQKLVEQYAATALVIGVPRGLNAQETQQTNTIKVFTENLRGRLIKIPVYLQDEAVTSVKAEEELRARGQQYTKADIDSLAAVYILEDFLHEHAEELTTN